ncbi:MAG: aspartate ammonia-lyase [Oscillospiraceae bacterium]
MADFRIEKDSIGDKEVPVKAYYGVQSLRGAENFVITNTRMHSEMINSLAYIKKACAIANNKVGLMDKKVCDAICEACDEIVSGKLHDEFICDPIQGGAGTTANMNANEVIANRAQEILGGALGDYSIVHPNDHVNYGQSTNDVYPTSGKLTVLRLLDKVIVQLNRMYDALMAKSVEFDDVIKMGRTQLQDAVPVRLGQEFHAYASAVKRDLTRLENAKKELYAINMGGTAIGTGINADETYFKEVSDILADVCGLPVYQTEDVIDGTQNLDCYVAVSGILKTCVVTLSKMSNDLRLMSSGPRTGIFEINLPAKQNGSSIMPGKVNPVIPEVMSQVAFLVIGNDTTVTMAAEAGQFELNAFEPVTFKCLIESLVAMEGGIKTMVDNCVTGITANVEHCAKLVENSVGIITAIAPHVGYAKSAAVAKKAIKTGESVRKLTIEAGLATAEELDIILDAKGMTEPGISGKQLLHK